MWFERAGSSALAQLVQNRRRWSQPTRLSGFPGCGKRVMHHAALRVRGVVTLVVRDEFDNGPLG